MKSLSELRTGDPVECCRIINLNPPISADPPDESLFHEEWVPGTIVYADAYSLRVGFSDGERRDYPRDPRQIRSAR